MRAPSTFKIAALGVMLAAALILSLLESLLPPFFAFAPYLKIGFANVVCMAVLLLMDYVPCVVIIIVKCVLVGVFSGNPMSILYALPAGLCAYTVTALLLKTDKLGIIAISTLSSVIHVTVQAVVAHIVAGAGMLYVLPYLILVGGLCGFLMGALTYAVLRYLPDSVLARFRTET